MLMKLINVLGFEDGLSPVSNPYNVPLSVANMLIKVGRASLASGVALPGSPEGGYTQFVGWTAIPSQVVTSGGRLVTRLEWAGGTGTPPTSRYVGVNRLVTSEADAADIMTAPATETPGAHDSPPRPLVGRSGWSPVLTFMLDGSRQVLRVTWSGGTGTPPPDGFVGQGAIVSAAAQAVDLRGSSGADSGASGLSVMTFALPHETPATHGTEIMERALASTANDLRIPSGIELVINAPLSTQIRLIGKTLRGPGTLRFTAGNLRVGSGAKALDKLRIRGTNKTNNGSGISVLSGSSDVLIENTDIADVSHNGVNINGGTSDIRVLWNRIKNCGGGTFIPTYQGCGVYASGQASAINGLRIANNDISETFGIGAIMTQSVTGVEVDVNWIRRTFFRGIYLTGTNTGSITNNHIRECGAINTSNSGVGCNGIMVNLTLLASDVVVEGNHITKVAENGIEGRCTIVGNTVRWTGAYPNLATPSIEGIYGTPESPITGNYVYDAEGSGIYVFGDSPKSGINVTGNHIFRPKEAGVRLLAKGATFSSGIVGWNVVHGSNAPTQFGIDIGVHEELGGSYSDIRAVGNEVFGRTQNQTHSSVTTRSNSWQ
jgi:hypothetical protein